MIVDDAIQLAMESVKKLFVGSEYRLEEVQSHEDGGFSITVSYRAPEPAGTVSFTIGNEGNLPQRILEPSTLRKRTAFGIDASRTYKDVSISSAGQVKSIRMRQIVLG